MALLPCRRKTTIEVFDTSSSVVAPARRLPSHSSPLGLRRTTVNLSMTMDNINKK
jgi:hypothetical protein